MKSATMKFSVLYLTFIFIIINSISSYAYNGNFTQINNEEGLSQNTIQCMIQDKLGFIWIGTNDGLNRYNGYEFKIYKYDKNKSNSIAGNDIIDLLEDKNNNIWVATSNGLSKINTITDEITNYSNQKESGNLSYYMITDILLTSNGKILVSTFDGLNLYNEETDRFERILKGDALISQTIYSIEEDIYGDFWMATSKGISRIVDNNKKIYNYPTRLNEETGQISSGDYIFKIECDSKGYLWASTFRYGIYKVDLKDYSFVKYTHDENDDTSLPGNYVRDVLRDRSNQVWVATNNGLASYNEKDETFTTYSKKSYDSKSIIQNEVHSLMQDNSGIVWVGTYSGINIFDPNIKIEHYKNNPLDKNSISESMVTTIYEDKNKYLWVGTYSNGINLINRDTGEIIRLASSGDYDFMVSDYINYITGYKNEIYIATDYGLNILNTDTKEISTYTESDGLIDNNIKNLFVDSHGNLWMGSVRGVMLLKNNKEITDITNYIKENRNLNLYTKCIYEDKNGAIWIGFGLNGGLVKIENKNGKYKFTNYMHSDDKNSIISDTIRVITEDDLGNLWIGTKYGLSKLNLKANKFTNYTTNDGLATDVVNGLLIDDNNNPWISGNKGISKFDINKNSFENFNTTDGLQGDEYYANSYFKSSSGELLFGGINGLDIFYPEDIEKSKYIPPLTFEEFKVNGKTITKLNDAKLKHNQSEISIKMFLPDYRNSSNITYYYKLNNLRDYNNNKKWLSTQSNEINYSGLSPGKYEIKIKAMNHNGKISEEKIINFIIEPPFWRSTTAIIIYISLAIIFIYYIINHVKYLDNLVNTRTMDLAREVYTNNELLTKVVALEKSKNNYFVNLSHELRTPLNVICTSEQLITSLNNSDKGLERDKLNTYMDVIRKNAKRLLNLINNLIDGSKIENGNYKIDLEDNDIVYIVEEAALSLKNYIESKGIELIVDPEIEEKIIKCDAYEIERCIINLVSNAYKFTPSGGKIEVRISELGEKTKIDVIDTGIGIDKKYHEIIFDRFNQVADAHSETKGSGLGLTITKQIINLHGGTISLDSEIGKGSKFTIIL